VLTARHCLVDADPIDMAVESGSEGELGQFGVAEIRLTDGALVDDNDFAILILTDRIDVEPVPWARAWDPVAEDPITLVGYGLTDSQFVGIKYEGASQVEWWSDRYFITHYGQNGCYGDSGGTGLDADGTLVGVITHILYGPFADECESGRTGLNRVDFHAAAIDEALADATICEESEICGDAIDDDCDGAIDDGCVRPGAPCTDAGECQSGDCRDVGAGRFCTEDCTPGSFVDTCPAPTECRRLPDGGGTCLDEPVGGPEPDAGGADSGAHADDAGTDRDRSTYGCGCRIAPADRGAAALLWLLLAIVWRLRK
jgi:MYXO-CTERM domain-containing protein